MRIVAGRFRGLRLQGPPKGGPTRPTTDRARESLFSVIGPRIHDARFLDLYGGTGAIAIEALSRGAAEVVTVECHPRAQKILRKNLGSLPKGTSGIRLAATRVERVLAAADAPYDLIFADPPFKILPAGVLEMVASSAAMGPDTDLYIEYRRDQNPAYPDPLPAPPGLVRGRTYRSGEQEITAFRRVPTDAPVEASEHASVEASADAPDEASEGAPDEASEAGPDGAPAPEPAP